MTRPVNAQVTVPGSKSQTNRILLLSAIADGPSRIVRPLRARDTTLMADALRAVGASVTDDGGDWLVAPGPLHGGVIDTGLAGTVMRFMPPIAALADGPVTFDGDSYARERPMATLIDGLRQAGAVVDDDGRGRLPFTVHGTGAVTGGAVHIDASASSQFVSGAVARRRPASTRASRCCTPAPVRSAVAAAHRDDDRHAARRRASTPVRVPTGMWHVAPGAIRARDWVVEPDLSNAAPFLAAAMVTGGSVTVPAWPEWTTQAGDALRHLLVEMGASVVHNSDGLTVSGSGEVAGLDADLHDVGELTPVLAAVAAVADVGVAAARHRPPARPRDRPAGRAGHRTDPAGR